MRQPRAISRKEKLQHVEEVIKLLGMEEYAEAVVGVPGESKPCEPPLVSNHGVAHHTGLNFEQCRCLTIAAELAARPQLLVLMN